MATFGAVLAPPNRRLHQDEADLVGGKGSIGHRSTDAFCRNGDMCKRASLLIGKRGGSRRAYDRSEEHTSELQSLMRISYAVFCLKKKKHHKSQTKYNN